MRSVKTTLLRLFTGCTALLAAIPTASAGDDFGIWGEVGVTKAFGKKLSLGGEIGYRANDNLRSSSRFDVGAGLAYKPFTFLKLSTGFAFIESHNLKEVKEHYNNSGTKMNGYNIDLAYWRPKYRWYFDVTGKVDAARFTFSLRERYQVSHYGPATCDRLKYRGAVGSGFEGESYNGFQLSETTTDRKTTKQKHYLRSRLGVEYNIRHCPVTPYATFEISNNLSNGFSLDKRRWTAGIDWKIQKKHTISVAYVYTNGNDDDDEGNLHALSLGYNFKF